MNSIIVKSAELISHDEGYALNTNVDINFDASIEEAISKGVPLTFLYEFQIVKPYEYWFDDEIVTVSKEITLSYHALTKQYLVKHLSQQQSFETLSEAKQAISHVNDWVVAKKEDLEKGEVYQASILMRLDKKKLPKALQVDAIGSEDWNLISPVFSWSLKDIK